MVGEEDGLDGLKEGEAFVCDGGEHERPGDEDFRERCRVVEAFVEVQGVGEGGELPVVFVGSGDAAFGEGACSVGGCHGGVDVFGEEARVHSVGCVSKPSWRSLERKSA